MHPKKNGSQFLRNYISLEFSWRFKTCSGMTWRTRRQTSATVEMWRMQNDNLLATFDAIYALYIVLSSKKIWMVLLFSPSTMSMTSQCLRYGASHSHSSRYQWHSRSSLRSTAAAARTVRSTVGSRRSSAGSSEKCWQRSCNAVHPLNWTSLSLWRRRAAVTASATGSGLRLAASSGLKHSRCATASAASATAFASVPWCRFACY